MYTKILHIFAEIEAFFSRPGDSLYWRHKELDSLGVILGNPIWIGRHLRIWGRGNIILGDRVALPYNTQLMNHGSIEIGDDFIAAPDLIINAGTHDPITMNPASEKIIIGNRVWCGTRVTILAGVRIGNDVVVGAGSVVNKSIPDNVIVAGVPARVIRSLDRSNVKDIWSWASSIKK
jgi:maltose O-acetyltransferase